MFLKPKSVEQVAILPFVAHRDGIEVLLITSRERGRWILPKGWPVSGRSLPSSAALEALEEAGVLGPVDETPIGSYTYKKEMDQGYSIRCHAFVYPMLVRQHFLDWPERGERKLKWCGLGEAANLLDDTDLAAVLEDLTRVEGAPLTALFDAMADAEFDEAGFVEAAMTEFEHQNIAERAAKKATAH